MSPNNPLSLADELALEITDALREAGCVIPSPEHGEARLAADLREDEDPERWDGLS
jgi:hypothetical protein